MKAFGIDLNFYPTQHLAELDGLTDIEVPEGWTTDQLIQALYDAKVELWMVLHHTDEDGTTWWG